MNINVWHLLARVLLTVPSASLRDKLTVIGRHCLRVLDHGLGRLWLLALLNIVLFLQALSFLLAGLRQALSGDKLSGGLRHRHLLLLLRIVINGMAAITSTSKLGQARVLIDWLLLILSEVDILFLYWSQLTGHNQRAVVWDGLILDLWELSCFQTLYWCFKRHCIVRVSRVIHISSHSHLLASRSGLLMGLVNLSSSLV